MDKWITGRKDRQITKWIKECIDEGTSELID